jgi:predicted amidohydrolase YtcJ
LGGSLGCVAVGYRADLTVLPRSPFLIDPHDLARLLPEMTLVDGKVVFQV